jgi:hypothetical protein
MLLLAGRACDAADLMKEVSAAGAHFLVRGGATRKPPVDEVLPDGSCLSRVDGLRGGSSRPAWTCTVPTEPGSGTATG